LTVPVDSERILAQLRRWQERLLDLTKANPLLGINRTRVSKLRVLEPDAQALFRDFVVEERALKMPRVVKIARQAETGTEGEGAAEPAHRVEPGDVGFEAKPTDLYRRLRRLYDNARTTVEERGVTTLHLSFGLLRWEDPALEESSSPLWLVPCELESFGPSAPMRLSRADEEMQLNPALELYLRERHRVTLPQFPEEPTPEALAAFLDAVRLAVREHGWRVEEEVWLSTYSFESLVLYQDLKSMAEVALNNGIVAALARATPVPEASEALGEEKLDTAPTPEQVPVPVLPTDSSQLKALTLAQADRHLVVHGPPGTGKSQTISNLIANALRQNKTVLFVSAKMAALNVVHARLGRLGLARFCLEAHSTKAGKAKIIEELRRTLVAAERDSTEDRFEERLEDLIRVREELNTYVLELHVRRAPLGLSIYQAIGRAERLRREAEVRAPLPWDDPPTVRREELNAALDALADLGAQAEVFDGRASHPWRGLGVDPSRPVRRELIENDLLRVQDGLRALHAQVGNLAVLFGEFADSGAWSTLQALAPHLADLATLERLPHDWATREITELLATADLLAAAAVNAEEEASKRAQHDAVLDLPVEEAARLLGPAETEFQSPIRFLRLAYWQWRRAVRRHLKPGANRSLPAIRSYFAVAQRVQALEEWFERQEKQLAAEVGLQWIRDAGRLREGVRELQVAARFRTALDVASLPPPPASSALTHDLRRTAAAVASAIRDQALNDAVARIDLAWTDGFAEGVPVASAPMTTVLGRCAELLAALPRFHEWIVLQHTLQRCRELGLGPFIEGLGHMGARGARGAFERRFYTAWVNAGIEGSPPLAVFAGARREERIDQFRALDGKIRESALARTKVVASDPTRRVATARGGIGTASEVGILRRELAKQRRFKPLRKLFAEIPDVLQALKPCMLMSPLSVSTFLKPDAISFDLVVFDEASQLPTQEAVPAILRAKQVVVAGDAKQLPPTSFFTASVIFDEEGKDADSWEELEPLESLLDDCVAIFPVFDHAHLRWHYRSRDERLIKFSNHYFYREQPLITFPSVSRSGDDRGVRLLYLADGVWDRGGSRTNRAEARAVAKLVVEQLDRCPDRSVGVVAMNVTQREAIEEALDECLVARPDLVPLLRQGGDELFFVKALENVQGDERDVIIISVGYGKSATGVLSFNFGPLNLENGWRRLNVLVTRARWQTILVTSMRSQELAGVNPDNRGAVALRNFIAYAERSGELPPDSAVLTGAETNDFEDAVAEALRERGLEVDQQVGASEYRIDLAIRDRRDPSRYVLGIECDGATYHSAKTARDRDLLREQVLREQGWRLHRIWSTDWFRDCQKAINSVLRALERAEQAPLEKSVPAPPRPATGAPGGSETTARETSRTGGSRAEPTEASSAGRRYPPGEPYRKYRESGRRELMLEPNHDRSLASQITRAVDFEGPIHKELLIERLKEINRVARTGSNIQANVNRAIKLALRGGEVEQVVGHWDFLKRGETRLRTFRVPGDNVERPLQWIAPEEVELAVLHVVEDQFGCQRDALPRVVGRLLGFERTPIGLSDVIGTVIDGLIERGLLVASGSRISLP
jgi:very-short-patch-repair endonuclease